jgi:hypothetical protein
MWRVLEWLRGALTAYHLWWVGALNRSKDRILAAKLLTMSTDYEPSAATGERDHEAMNGLRTRCVTLWFKHGRWSLSANGEGTSYNDPADAILHGR